MSYPRRSHERKRDGERRAVSAVTTNHEKSAEAIVGGNAEGQNKT